MGAGESRARGQPEDATAAPPDYYALLEVDETATADEIKVRPMRFILILLSNAPSFGTEIVQKTSVGASSRQERARRRRSDSAIRRYSTGL